MIIEAGKWLPEGAAFLGALCEARGLARRNEVPAGVAPDLAHLGELLTRMYVWHDSAECTRVLGARLEGVLLAPSDDDHAEAREVLYRDIAARYAAVARERMLAEISGGHLARSVAILERSNGRGILAVAAAANETANAVAAYAAIARYAAEVALFAACPESQGGMSAARYVDEHATVCLDARRLHREFLLEMLDAGIALRLPAHMSCAPRTFAACAAEGLGV